MLPRSFAARCAEKLRFSEGLPISFAALPPSTAAEPLESFSIATEKHSFSAHRAAEPKIITKNRQTSAHRAAEPHYLAGLGYTTGLLFPALSTARTPKK